MDVKLIKWRLNRIAKTWPIKAAAAIPAFFAGMTWFLLVTLLGVPIWGLGSEGSPSPNPNFIVVLLWGAAWTLGPLFVGGAVYFRVKEYLEKRDP